MTTELQQSANEVALKKKHDAFARHMANAAEALVDALAQSAQDAAASAQEIRERDECIQEQQALLDRCAEVLEHALANVKALTGGDERRMRQLLSALRKEDNARDLLLDENAELRRKLEAREGPVPGLAEEGPYSLADVELIEKARGKPYARLRATVLERDSLRDFAQSFADEPCAYGDGCEPNVGSRHGKCTPCRAREALGR